MQERDKKSIIDIIIKHLPSVRIYLFGSRARGDNHATSDIDIALDAGKKIDEYILGEIREAIEESAIPFTVDVVDMYMISEDFRVRILKDGKIWH